MPSRAGWLQLTQAPPHATLQQTPSAQNPEAHWAPVVQTAPWGLGPQLPETHLTPETQSASDRQSAKHAPALASQPKGAQIVCGPGWQLPCPSHTSPPVTAAPWQVPGLHTIPAGYCRQLPCPSQVPSRPHVATSDLGHVAAEGGGLPAGTKLQTPGAPGMLQALHASVQAVSQQTPSTQNPLAQSPAHPQAWPFGFLSPASPVQATSAPPSWCAGSASGLVLPCVLPQPAAKYEKAKAREAMADKDARATVPGGRRGKLIVGRNLESLPSDHKSKVPQVRAIAWPRASRPRRAARESTEVARLPRSA